MPLIRTHHFACDWCGATPDVETEERRGEWSIAGIGYPEGWASFTVHTSPKGTQTVNEVLCPPCSHTLAEFVSTRR